MTTWSSNTFLVTTEPAPTVTLAPIFTFGSTVEPAPTKVLVPISTLPNNTVFDATCEYSLIKHSCSTIAPVFII